LFILNAVVDWLCLATDLIAQTALSSLPRVIYYLEQLFRMPAHTFLIHM
jgi:hypothetical protein